MEEAAIVVVYCYSTRGVHCAVLCCAELCGCLGCLALPTVAVLVVTLVCQEFGGNGVERCKLKLQLRG